MARESNSKQRLIPWLVSQLDRKETPGLEWVNEGLRQFKIPWKHGGKQNFDSEGDSKVFRDWAIHTGRYSPASDKPDPTKWKQNLRCAFNKSKDIVEVKDQHYLEGPEPYKVYQIIPREMGEKRLVGSNQSANKASRIQEADSSTSDGSSTIDLKDDNMGGATETAGPYGTTIPALEAFQSGPSSSEMASLPDSLKQLRSSDLMRTDLKSQELLEAYKHDEAMETSNDGMIEYTETAGQQNLLDLPPERILPAPTAAALLRPAQEEDAATALHIAQQPAKVEPNLNPNFILKVEYCQETVLNIPIDSPSGCRIMHSKDGHSFEGVSSIIMNKQEESQVFGDSKVQTVCLPPFVVHSSSALQQKGKNKKKLVTDCQMALDAMYRGLILKSDNGSIVAYRYCKCGIHYASDQTNREPKKLERVKRDNSDGVVLFDFNHFCKMLHEYIQGNMQGRKPHPTVYLVLGQPFSADACIVVKVTSQRAIDTLEKCVPNSNADSVEELAAYMQNSPMISRTDSGDRQAMAVQIINEMGLIESNFDEGVVMESMDGKMEC